MPAAGIYCRISVDRDGEAAGIGRQEHDCRELAARRGWSVDSRHVFVDNSRSAWKRDRRRPGWDALLDAVKNRELDAIVVYHGDRLIRQPRDLEDLLDIADSGVQLASPSGTRDLANADDRFILRIEAAHACRSSDDTSRRVTRKHLEMAQQGKVVGSGRPYGYQVDRVTIDAAEAALIREAARRVADGDSVRSIAIDWNRRRVPGPKGGLWHQTTLNRILVSPRVAGKRGLGGDVVADAEWEPILDDLTWRRVRLILLEAGRHWAGFGAARYLLSGVAVCGLCGKKLVARPHAGGDRYYGCKTDPGRGACGRIRVSAGHLDDEVTARVIAAYDTPDLIAAINDRDEPTDERALLDGVADDEATLDQLARDLANKLLTRSEWLAARQVIEQRISAARRQLVHRVTDSIVERWAAHGTDLQGAWATLTVEQRRAAITAIVEELRVNTAVVRGGRFDAARVVIRWKSSVSQTADGHAAHGRSPEHP